MGPTASLDVVEIRKMCTGNRATIPLSAILCLVLVLSVGGREGAV